MGKIFLILLSFLVVASSAFAGVIFEDNFDNGPDPAWGNERGSWFASGGVYDASFPNNSPATYSLVSTFPSLRDFTVEVTVNNLRDGGIWLRTDDNLASGVVLVTGGYGLSYSGLYWHTMNNGGYSLPTGHVYIPGLLGSNAVIKVEVEGDYYRAYVNGSSIPATVLQTSLFESGKVGLYDYSPQTFDDFKLSAVPEPASTALLGLGGAVMAFFRRKTR